MAHTLVTPRYYQDFQCIGDKCEDNCCHGWTISIDKKTYRNYVSHPDLLIQSTAKQHIEKVKKSDAREFNFEVRHSPMPPDGTLRIP